ncbi:hypothetical protein HMPREF1586_01149 [Gardnerella vaginalis JCP8522]|nr:hypothetical protein HMPREF1586_01149 [Gardnerella vaginalis JCP8522]
MRAIQSILLNLVILSNLMFFTKAALVCKQFSRKYKDLSDV